MITPAAPQGPSERQQSSPPSEKGEDSPDGEYESAHAEIALGLSPDTGEIRSTAKAKIGAVVLVGVGGPTSTLSLARHAGLDPNWTGVLVLVYLILAGWLALKHRKR